LVLGVLYTYSIFKEAISASIKAQDGYFTWDLASLNDPYAVCCLMLAFAVFVAGRVQDKLGPRITAMIGGVLTGLGLIWVSLSYSLVTWVLGFGVMGMGLGFGYAASVPPALKWFPPSKTGMITGIVVSGFGLASVYIAPLAQFLIDTYGLSISMRIFGIGFLLVVCVLAQFLVNPPAGYRPEGVPDPAKTSTGSAPSHGVDFQPTEVLHTGAFYKLWLMFAIGAGTGLVIIGNVAGMAKQSLGAMAWIVVALVAVANAGGRVVAGLLSDKIGRMRTVALIMLAQSAIMVALLLVSSANAIFTIFAATFVGFNYGANLSLFPASTKEFFGLKNFGANYGLIFTAWGVGGLVFPKLSQMIVVATGTFNAAYVTAAILLAIAAGVALMTNLPRKLLVCG
jgi:MFS family permease